MVTLPLSNEWPTIIEGIKLTFQVTIGKKFVKKTVGFEERVDAEPTRIFELTAI